MNISKGISTFGKESPSGTYLLILKLLELTEIEICSGSSVYTLSLSDGYYVYVGSALGVNNSTNLKNRILRHLNRQSGPKHKLFDNYISVLIESSTSSINLDQINNRKKKLFWNIDFVLESLKVEISSIFIYRSKINLEDLFADFLMKNSFTTIVKQGFGANDKTNQTHFFQISDQDNFLNSLNKYMTSIEL